MDHHVAEVRGQVADQRGDVLRFGRVPADEEVHPRHAVLALAHVPAEAEGRRCAEVLVLPGGQRRLARAVARRPFWLEIATGCCGGASLGSSGKAAARGAPAAPRAAAPARNARLEIDRAMQGRLRFGRRTAGRRRRPLGAALCGK